MPSRTRRTRRAKDQAAAILPKQGVAGVGTGEILKQIGPLPGGFGDRGGSGSRGGQFFIPGAPDLGTATRRQTPKATT